MLASAYAPAAYQGEVDECTVVYRAGGNATAYTFRVPGLAYQQVWAPTSIHALLLLPTQYSDDGQEVTVVIASAEANGGTRYTVTAESAGLPTTCTQPVCIYAETIGTDTYLATRFTHDSPTQQTNYTWPVTGTLKLTQSEWYYPQSSASTAIEVPFGGAVAAGNGRGVFASARIGPARGEITIEVPTIQTYVPDYVAVGFKVGDRVCTALVNLQPYIER